MAQLNYNYTRSDLTRTARRALYSRLNREPTALYKVYDKWGKEIVKRLKMAAPKDTGALIRNITYDLRVTGRIRSAGRVGAITSVRMAVGVLAKNKANVPYLRHLIYGTTEHWVGFRKHPEVLKWALKNGIVRKRGKEYIFADTGRTTTALHVQGLQPNDFFTRIARQVDIQFRQEIASLIT